MQIGRRDKTLKSAILAHFRPLCSLWPWPVIGSYGIPSCTTHRPLSTAWVNPPPLCGLRFSDIFWKTVENFKSIFRHLLYVHIYARLQIFIQLSETLTKLCHIKRDYLVHVICSKCPASAETHAFRRLWKSLIALSIVICGKSSQICCFYNVYKHVGYDMTWRHQWRHLLGKPTYKKF